MKQTWLDIHRIAAQDCANHGPDGVNTAKIAELAGVSPRTFFNYFATKEDAILGLGRPELLPEHIEIFIADTGRKPLLRVSILILFVLRSAFGNQADPELRRELAAQYPELKTRLSYPVIRARDLILTKLVTEASELWQGAEGLPNNRDEAYALVMIAFTVVAFSWQHHPERLSTEPEKVLIEAISIVTAALETSL